MDILEKLQFSFGGKLPVILQTEAAECGLACLAMIASYYGYGTDLPGLRRRFSLSLKGANLAHIVDIAERIGLQGRPLRLELEDLPQLKAPALLHWDLNHFVVLKQATASKVIILDPATGLKKLNYDEVSKHFTGVALELTPTVDFEKRPAPPAVTLRELTGPIHGLKRALAQILLLSLCLQVFVMLGPFYMQWVIDQVLVSADRGLLTLLGIGFALLMLFQSAIGLLRSWAVVYLSTTLGVQWTSSVFAHLLKLPLDYFEKRHLGDIVSRMGAIQSIQRLLSTSFVEAIIDGMMTIVTFVLMLVYSVKLALITLAAVALYITLRAILFQRMREGTEQQLVCAAKQQSHLLESIRGVQSVKIAGQESLRRAGWQNLLVDTTNRDLHLSRLNLGFTTSSQVIFGVERIAVIWIGALLTLDGVFSVGVLIAYLAYKDQFAGRISGLIDKWIEFRMLRLYGERLADIVLTPPETGSQSLIEAAPLSNVRIEVRGLSFRYAEGESWVLKDCSFVVDEGESVAIVGPSGCGKTTLIKVLLGLLTPTEGVVTVGGEDIRRLGPSNYRAMLGAVMQDDQLFAGSVADNICFSDPEATQARIQAAAELAAVHQEIAAMPMGYHSLIGDMGTVLSGGQKQRVVLARALYRKPKLLFLDEATSHLDVQTEHLVNDSVRQLELTKLIVAHRPETIASADRVLVMQDGSILREFRPKDMTPIMK